MKIDFDLLIAHEDNCGARTIKCPKCKMYVVTKEYDEHVKKGKCRRHNENVNENMNEVNANVQQYRISVNNNNEECLRERDKYDERAKRLQQRDEEQRNERVKRKEDKKLDIEKEMEIMQLKRDLMANNNNYNNNNHHYHHWTNHIRLLYFLCE